MRLRCEECYGEEGSLQLAAHAYADAKDGMAHTAMKQHTGQTNNMPYFRKVLVLWLFGMHT